MTARRFGSLAGAVAVTVIPAVASYDHMRTVALDAGQPAFLAALLPLSLDGLVLVGTVALGDGRRSRWSAWLAFLVGVAASLAANVMAAEPHPVPCRVRVARRGLAAHGRGVGTIRPRPGDDGHEHAHRADLGHDAADGHPSDAPGHGHDDGHARQSGHRADDALGPA
ncbi:DUF2637 domain-containing protein [Micromonospora sp. AP08]|uniref:DUF2637 domain-containing protein n=1 Tax=Micromonospora sp. AP08 TaxID=2604467 RepID=UPI0011D979DA|nr:DUF2637 domain-containing protein [Micromonospora sp. AP08]TYB34831.1 DUF2637 domain-containing protein [Micromonospora sp. AP08]